MTTRKFLEENPEAVEGFLAATSRGWTEALASPDEAVDVTMGSYGADLGLDPDNELAVVEAQIPLVQSDYTAEHGVLAMDPDAIAGPMYDALTASGRTDLPDPEVVFDTTLVQPAKESK